MKVTYQKVILVSKLEMKRGQNVSVRFTAGSALRKSLECESAWTVNQIFRCCTKQEMGMLQKSPERSSSYSIKIKKTVKITLVIVFAQNLRYLYNT
jgi:hypothetical protein